MHLNPILLDITETIDTDRLQLRAVMPGDGAQHCRAFAESVQDLRRYLGHLLWVAEEPSLIHSETYCRKHRAHFIERESLLYFIYLKSEQRMIGSVALHEIDWQVPKMEIGYWCSSRYQGQGYTTEAVNALTTMAMTELVAQRIEIQADDVNIASWQVAQRCGFQREGLHRNFLRDATSGRLIDLRVYAKLAGQ